jgi:CTP synthase (UTP-ammonia lyase)
MYTVTFPSRLAPIREQRESVEIVECKTRPCFLDCQFHPELKSRPFEAYPLFRELIQAAPARRQKSASNGGCAKTLAAAENWRTR